MKKYNFFILIMMFALIVGCPDNQDNPTNGSDDQTIPTDSQGTKLTSLQAVIDTTTDGAVINLSEYPNINNYSATINKAITINGSANVDLSQATLSVSQNGVNLTGLVNANVTTTAALGNGSLKISSSSLNSLVLNGGGMNSINLDNVTIADLTADYPWVRLHILDNKTKITNFVAKQNCKIEDDLSTDTNNNNTFIDNLVVTGNVIAEVKTVVDKLNILGDNAEVNLSRANSFIKSVAENLSSTLFNTFRLTSIEEVQMGTILNNINIPNDYRNKVQYKTSEIINGIEDRTKSAFDDVSYNFDGFVKAWDKYKDKPDAQEWKNYTNLRILDKYNGVPITGIRSKALQMSQWLTSVDIGENVTTMGELPFLGCCNLKTVYMRPTVPPTIVPLTSGDSNPMLFFTTDDQTNDKTKLDRTLFDPTSDFISAEGIDCFIEWYKQSDYADDDNKQMIADINDSLASMAENSFIMTYLFDVSSIGHFLKDKTIREWEPLIKTSDAPIYNGIKDNMPSDIIERIMTEWDKTLTQIDISKVTIYVPTASVAAYKEAPGWSRYADNIIGIDDFSAEVNAE